MKGRLEILQRPHQGQAARQDVDLQTRRAPVARLLRRGPRQPRQRGRHPRRAAQQEGRSARPSSARRSSASSPGRSARAASSATRRRRSSPTTRAATPSCSASCPSATRCPRSASSAAAWPSATRWACPTEDRYLQSKAEFEDKIAGMLGGNASEQLDLRRHDHRRLERHREGDQRWRAAWSPSSA